MRAIQPSSRLTNWDQIIILMQTIENVPIENADAILEYLKTAR